MYKKKQTRYLLFVIPLLVNFIMVASGLTLATTLAQADPATRQAIDPTPLPEGLANEAEPGNPQTPSLPAATISIHPTIYLQARQFQPTTAKALDVQALQQLAAAGQERTHILVQLDFIPRQAARDELAARGLNLLAYVPDYAWIASIPVSNPEEALSAPGVIWAGELQVDDKLAPAIRAGQWGAWNFTSEGRVAVYLALHKDESLETGRQLVKNHNGQITGEVIDINLLVVEMPQEQIRALAAEEAVQWIEPAAPALTGVNDGIRNQIGVNTVQAAPYNLNGTGIDILVYDSGQVGNHVDFTGRLIHGDGDTVSEHSTHVAGTVGGSGSNSLAQGGTALQWRGMAPAADLISYGTGYSGSGITFYENVPDIQADWAAAQNSYGADLGTASLGSNIYAYWQDDCWVMGNYGASSVLIDQIVRGGNATVGIGDKYIAAWAAGNERGWGTSCAGLGGGYGLVAPPAAAKNPIHVGGSNTNNNTQYAHTSWGPTDDGRIKPIVTAGACQTTDDGGITSTDDSPVNTYTVMCGTSMATPGVSGGIALMLQHYRAIYNTSGSFWPSTAKAILMQTADDFGNPGPDYQWGYGQVDIQAAVDLISRKAFRQDNVAHGSVDVFYFIVPNDTAPATVTLAWDDYETTLNANPTLVNDLDLELESPSGVIVRPWVLNPASPAANATRGVDHINNQEQVQIPDASLEIGTWIVRVKGTSVPQGPQDYSLVCEGCKVLDLGVCQTTVSTLQAVTNELDTPNALQALTGGEIWQRALEQPRNAAERTEAATAWQQFAKAREQGPEAILALEHTLTGETRDQVMDEIVWAREQIWDAAPPPPSAPAISEAQEAAAIAAQAETAQENRRQALADYTDPAEGRSETAPLGAAASVPGSPAADRTVGNSCTYATIAAAIAAANPGDRLLLEGGRTFAENITIPINLTVQGGYAGCATGSSERTTLDGSAVNSVVVVNAGTTVSLQNLNITNGSTGVEGGGIRFAIGAGAGTLQLSNVQIYGNQSAWGGGLWVGPNAEVTGEAVEIYNNTANTYGGGVRLYGSRITLSDSNIHDNSAPYGGGIYATQQDGYTPSINLPSYADLYQNMATTGSGLGGGMYLREGTVTIADCSDVYNNQALQGGGTYLITSTLTIEGSCSEIDTNTATNNGGGIYAQGSTINLDNDAELYHNSSTSGNGGGAYLDNSDLWSDKALIWYNTASGFGGGVYALNGSLVDMDIDNYTCLSMRCSRLYYNTSTNNYGGGIYAVDSSIDLRNTFVELNTALLGGGVYAYGSPVSLYNDVFAGNNATSTAGDGIRLYTGSTLNGQNNTLAYNDASLASTGRAIDTYNSSLTLNCSVIWGHSVSLNETGHTVTYSDIQDGYTGDGNLAVTPQFVATASRDYHLLTTSPLIDRCLSGISPDFENENRPIVRDTAASPYDMGADEVSGTAHVGINGSTCEYSTIQQAINAAADGDTIQIAEGTYFENLSVISKDLTIAGGYDSTCTLAGTLKTRLEGSARTTNVLYAYNSELTVRDLELAWGSGAGAGLYATTNSAVTLENADITDNHGSSGGGIYVSGNSTVTARNGSELYENTASSNGGGAYVVGELLIYDNDSDIYDNCAANGGGFAVPGGTLYLNSADAYRNLAADAASQGGGILVTDNGAVTLSNGTYVYYLNQAYDGAGIYADNAQVTLESSSVYLRDNIASHNGGGIYLNNGSVLQSTGGHIGQAGSTLANEAQYGAGIYANDSTVTLNGGYLINNIASVGGGGLYANNSTVSMSNVQVGGTEDYQANQLGPSGHYGAGLYLTGGTVAALDSSLVSSNLFQTTGYTYGGGAYLSSSSVLTLTNSTVASHLAPSAGDGRGAGLYVSASTVTLDNSQVISNTAGTVGGGFRLLNTSTLNVLNGSIIRNNQAINGEGGGIAASGTPDINIANATLRDNSAGTNGGGVYYDGGTLDFNGGWTLYGNTAGVSGGAVAAMGTGDPRFSAEAYSLVYFNRALGGSGGMVYLGNDLTTELYANNGSSMYIYANSASENGGALYAADGGLFDIYGEVNFDRNRADNGGAIYLSNGSSVWMDDYVDVGPALWDNWADNGSGGAIYAQDSPRVECDGATLGKTGDGNHATVNGGAIYLNGSTLNAENCTFRDNQAANHGGAIAAEAASALTIDAHFATLLSVRASESMYEVRSPEAPQATGCDPADGPCSVLAANLADSDANSSGDGGAIYLGDSTLQLDATVLQGNQAYRGGALYQTGSSSTQVNNSLFYANAVSIAFGAGIRSSSGTIDLSHVTIADNHGGAGFSQTSTTSSVINSIAWGNDSGGFLGTFATTACNLDQSNNAGSNLDPHFVAPGTGENYHLFGDSPAIDACATGLTPDLEGVARPFGGSYDMGVYEYAAGISFSPNHSESGPPGSPLSYAHTLTNTGGGTDTYTLSATSSQGWSVTIDPSPTIRLASGQSTTVTVMVAIPAGAAADTVDSTQVSAVSGLDPHLSASVTDTSTVIQVWHNIYLPLIMR